MAIATRNKSLYILVQMQLSYLKILLALWLNLQTIPEKAHHSDSLSKMWSVELGRTVLHDGETDTSPGSLWWPSAVVTVAATDGFSKCHLQYCLAGLNERYSIELVTCASQNSKDDQGQRKVHTAVSLTLWRLGKAKRAS